MGTTPFGFPQTITFRYNSDATAQIFNGVNYELTPTGIYNGFTLTRITNSLVSLSTGACFIQDSANNVGTRISTGAAEEISVSSTTPYIILRWGWANTANNYMDMLAVSFAGILPDDLIVGRCIYDGAGTTLSGNFDYTRRSVYFLETIKTQNSYLKVLPTEPYSAQIAVSAGILNSTSGQILVSGGDYPTGGITPTTNGRHDLVFINTSGQVEVLEGIDSSSPVAPAYGTRKVIAEIRRGAARNSINGFDIYQVLTSYDMTAQPTDLLIADAGNFYGATNVESALQEIAGSDFTFVGVKTFQGTVDAQATTGRVALRARGVSGQNIFELRNSSNTLIHRIDQNGKLINTIGAEIPFSDVGGVFTTDRYEEALNQLGNGAMTIRGIKTFESAPVIPVATGSPPLQVTSQTIVTNFNSDLVDGRHAIATESSGSIPVQGGNSLFSGITCSTYLKAPLSRPGTLENGMVWFE